MLIAMKEEISRIPCTIGVLIGVFIMSNIHDCLHDQKLKSIQKEITELRIKVKVLEGEK